MAHNIMQLKLQKAMLQERLRQVEMGTTKCVNLLEDKKKQKMEYYSSDPIPIEEQIMTRTGVPLSTFRLPRLSVKALPKGGGSGKENIEPEVINNSKLLRIKGDHLKKTICKLEITKRKKEEEVQEAKLQKRMQPKKYPTCSIPESMFPRRYERG